MNDLLQSIVFLVMPPKAQPGGMDMTDKVGDIYSALKDDSAIASFISDISSVDVSRSDSLHRTSGVTLSSIQSLRAVAAIIVVAFHSHISFASSYSNLWLANESYIFGFGKVGVHIFFVISGYIMYLTSFGLNKRFDPKIFLLKRFMRIYPIYWVFVAMYVATAYLLLSPPKLSLPKYFGMILLLPGPGSSVIGPAWTLSFEVYFYAIFAAAMVLGKARGIAVLTAFFLLSVVLGHLLRPQSAALSLLTNSLLLEFILGVWIAHYTTSVSFSKAVGWSAVVVAGVGYLIGLALGYDRLPSFVIWGVPSALLVGGAVVLEQRNSRILTAVSQKISWLGNSSYSLYLCHVLIISLILHTNLLHIGLIPLVVLNTIACVIFALIFYNLVESPLVQTLQRLVAKK